MNLPIAVRPKLYEVWCHGSIAVCKLLCIAEIEEVEVLVDGDSGFL